MPRSKPVPARSSEEELAALARGAVEGRSGAARAFVLAVAPLVLRTVRQILGRDHADLEDVVQEALVAALEALPRFRGACSTTHFVRRVGLLTALSARRRVELRRRIAPLADGTEADSLPARGTSPADAIDAERRRSVFLALLDELPPVQAEAIAMHCVLGYTVAETAAAAGVPLNTARGRIVAAKAALRERLAEDPGAHALFRGAS